MPMVDLTYDEIGAIEKLLSNPHIAYSLDEAERLFIPLREKIRDASVPKPVSKRPPSLAEWSAQQAFDRAAPGSIASEEAYAALMAETDVEAAE